ncbi:MAG: deoxyribose-phosphate aldolase [Desulfobacterales bacterium]|jgi:deoxyribose-phosphate aldolase
MTDKSISAAKMAKYIDHTLLKPEATIDAVAKLCAEAIAYGFKAVCVNSGHVAYIAGKLQGTGVAVCTVVGFPLGAMQTRAKAFEAKNAVSEGAIEIDMVLNIGALKSGDLKTVEADIKAVRQNAASPNVLKVIIETCLLTAEEKVKACKIAKNAGADYIKTSTGFLSGGATVEDVTLIRKTVGRQMGVKASGGIKDWPTAVAMIRAGASRIGTSSGIAIVENAPD